MNLTMADISADKVKAKQVLRFKILSEIASRIEGSSRPMRINLFSAADLAPNLGLEAEEVWEELKYLKGLTCSRRQ